MGEDHVASDLAKYPIWLGRQKTQWQSKTECHDMDGQDTVRTQRDLGGDAGVRDLRPWRSGLISKLKPQGVAGLSQEKIGGRKSICKGPKPGRKLYRFYLPLTAMNSILIESILGLY